MTEYQKQLKDPRWQKKRLEIMERDEWTCQTCGDTEATLTVHHQSYRMDDGVFADIWDYGGEDLITLCENCHSEEEEKLDRFKRNLFFDIRRFAYNANAIHNLRSTVKNIAEMSGGRFRPDDCLTMFAVYKTYAELSGGLKWHDKMKNLVEETKLQLKGGE